MQVYTPKPRERAMEQIEAYILQSGLKAGDSLPPEREMCRMWDLNRSTLRSAIARLEEECRWLDEEMTLHGAEADKLAELYGQKQDAEAQLEQEMERWEALSLQAEE